MRCTPGERTRCLRYQDGQCFGGAAGPGAGSAPCEPPCLKEQAVWLTGPLGVVLAGFHVVCVDGQGLLGRRFRGWRPEPTAGLSAIAAVVVALGPVAPAVTSTGSVHAAHQGVRAGAVVSAARWKVAGSSGAARLAEVGRENSAEREPDPAVARREGRAPGSAARAGASASASPAGGGRLGSSW